MNRFTRKLAERAWLLADGATRSNLFEMGLVSGDAPELRNIEHADRIALLHRRFIDAGADIVLSNSFGGNAYHLKLHQAQSHVGELNEAAARIARGVADAAARGDDLGAPTAAGIRDRPRALRALRRAASGDRQHRGAGADRAHARAPAGAGAGGFAGCVARAAGAAAGLIGLVVLIRVSVAVLVLGSEREAGCCAR